MTRALIQKSSKAIREIFDDLLNPANNLKMRWKLVNKHLIRRITREKRITGVEVQHTYRCNARCSFCSMGTPQSPTNTIEPALFDRILSECVKEGCTLMVFLGGETLVDRNIFMYLSQCWDAGIMTEIQSNGTMLTESNLLKLKEVHCRNISVTIHGDTADDHDGVYKVKGAYDRLMNAIEFCKKNNISISFKTLYSQSSEKNGQFQKILDMAKYHNMELNVNPFMPVGKGFGDNERLDAEHLLKWKKIVSTESCVSSHIYKNGQAGGCFAGNDYFCITPEGNLLPCYFMPISVGNIKTMSLREAQKIALSIPIFKERFPVCYVAESESFYKNFLVPLHQKYKVLPVNIVEHPEVAEMMRGFNMSNL